MVKALELEVARQTPPDVSRLQTTLAKMQGHLEKLGERRNRLYGLLEDGTYTRAVFTERMQVLIHEETGLRETISAPESEIHAALSRNQEKRLAQLKTVLERYQDASLPGKKALLQSIISDIQYTKEKRQSPQTSPSPSNSLILFKCLPLNYSLLFKP